MVENGTALMKFLNLRDVVEDLKHKKEVFWRQKQKAP
jgi:hypothetical protein